MTRSVADKVADIIRTRKRPRAVVRNWIDRERRQGMGWLAECIEVEWLKQTQQQLVTSPPVAPHRVEPINKPEPAQKAFWWQDD